MYCTYELINYVIPLMVVVSLASVFVFSTDVNNDVTRVQHGWVTRPI